MSWELLTDEAILRDLASRIDVLRRSHRLKDEELAARGGTSRPLIFKFRSGGGITLTTFIRILRGLGELGRLEHAFSISEEYHPGGGGKQTLPKRVREKADPGFSWGDEAHE